MSTCQTCGRPKLLDAFSGEGGAGVGYQIGHQLAAHIASERAA